MLTSEILDRAADLIQERGWGKGPNSAMSETHTCILGAVYMAVNGAAAVDEVDPLTLAAQCPAGLALFNYLCDIDPYITTPALVWHFNDAPERTASEVIEVLRACAVIEASREREAAEVSA